MKLGKLVLLAIFTGALIGFSASSSAITAGEILEDKDSSELYNYLAGLVDMLAYIQFVEGNDKRGNCIYNWYYRTEGSLEKIYNYLEKYKDKPPEAIMIVLAKRPCPLAKQEG